LAAINVEPKEEEEPKHKNVILGYWGIRGLGQVARLLLAYNGVDFENRQYKNSESWFAIDKTALSLEFPNLPYLITPDIRLTESTAIYKYIIDTYNPTLSGKNLQDATIINEVLGVWKDATDGLIGLFFDKDHEAHKGKILEVAKPKLAYLQKFIGNKDTVLGYLTLADFIIAESANYFIKIFPE